MRTNRLTIVLCACIAALFGCAGAPEEETELGTTEQAVLTGFLPDNVAFEFSVDTYANPAQWPTPMVNIMSISNGLQSRWNSVCSANGLPTPCPMTIEKDPCYSHGCMSANAGGKWIDFVWNPLDNGVAVNHYYTLTPHAPLTQNGLTSRGGVTIQLDNLGVSHVASQAGDSATVKSHQWALCRAFAEYLGSSTPTDTGSCAGPVPTNMTQLNARLGFSLQNYNDVTGPDLFGYLNSTFASAYLSGER